METRPPASQYRMLEKQDRLILEHANAVAVDRTTRKAANFMKQRVRSVGLKGLANAVGSTTSLQKGRRTGSNAYGAIFAKGGDDSLAGGALIAYSRGVTITPKNGGWLWFQTAAIARRIGRNRSTPARYKAAGSPLGPLKFRMIRPGLASLYAEQVIVSAKNGRARKPGPRSRGTVKKRVTIFFGVRSTRRAKRFDAQQIVSRFAGLVPAELADELRTIR